MLTPKQQRFVDEYLIDLNATQAATRAGYSKRTSNVQAAQLMKLPDIMAAIDRAKAHRSERTEINIDWVLRRLTEEADADLSDIYDDRGDLRPIEQWPLIWRQGLIQSVEVEALYEGNGKARVEVGKVTRIWLSDRVRRLELIGRHTCVNAFKESAHDVGLNGLGDRLDRAGRAAKSDIVALASPPSG